MVLLVVASVLKGVAIVGGEVIASSLHLPLQGVWTVELLCLSAKREV